MHALIVLGYHEFAADGRHEISAICRACVRRAEEIPADVVVFTGWSSTGGPSEAEQMRDAWRADAANVAELVVEPRARMTAENAAYALPLLVERGVERATVVCSIRHRIRVPYFFGALYREHGIEPSYEYVWRPFPGARIWLLEAGGLALMRRHRRAARLSAGQGHQVQLAVGFLLGEPAVDGRRALAAFGDRPDDQ